MEERHGDLPVVSTPLLRAGRRGRLRRPEFRLPRQYVPAWKSDAWIGLRLRSDCHMGDLSAAPAPRRMADRAPLSRRKRSKWAGTVSGLGRGLPRFVTRVRRCRAGFEDDRRRFASGSNERARQRRLRTIAHVRSCSQRPLSHGYTLLHWTCPTDVGTRGVASAPPMATPHCLIRGRGQG
jgi:hypothetical protein